jgi:hypothetical protein
MATSVRRLEGKRVEVMFGKPLAPDSPSAQKIAAFAAESQGNLIKENDQLIGIETTERDYVRFLQSINASKETIAAFRGALDDSKKAVRQRMRG